MSNVINLTQILLEKQMLNALKQPPKQSVFNFIMLSLKPTIVDNSNIIPINRHRPLCPACSTYLAEKDSFWCRTCNEIENSLNIFMSNPTEFDDEEGPEGA